MPPIDWSIVQSLLVTFVFPCFAVAFSILIAAYVTTRSETWRSLAAAIALVAAIAAGNVRGSLVPFLAMQHVQQLENHDSGVGHGFLFPWEFETGWYSLFSVTVIAVLAEIVIDLRPSRKFHLIRIAVFCGFVVVIAAWLTPWNLLSSKPWVCCLLTAVILLNTVTLRDLGRSKYGYWIPLILSVIWGGSATMIVVFAHSSRFAELAILLSCPLAAIGIMHVIGKQRQASIYAVPSAFIPGLMLGAALNTYSNIPAISFELVAVAPGLLGFHRIPAVREWCKVRPISLVIAFALPCIIAVGLAIRAEL